MAPLHIHTPLIQSLKLTQLCASNVWLKCENMQPTGSFKIRGIGLACQHYRKAGAKRLISSSGGNAGIAVAYAGRQLGIKVCVVVPETTTDLARGLIQLEGAELIVHGESWQEANDKAMQIKQADDAFIHPFDDPLLWQGHASIVDEIKQAGVNPDAIVVSVGGGGLFSGIIQGLRSNGWDQKMVLTAETVGAASLSQSQLENKRIELSEINTLATSLGAKRVCEQAFSYLQNTQVKTHVVSDLQALLACQSLLEDHRILVEPACGAALALCYEHLEILKDFENIVVVVCGGATMSLKNMQSWISQTGCT